MMTRFYYLLCFSFSQTISTVFWRLCLPSGFQQLSWCTSTSGSFCLLYMCVCNCILCVKCVHACISAQGLHGGGEAGKYARAWARDVQLGCCSGVDMIYIMVKCVVVIECRKKSSLFQFGQFSDLSHGVSNTFWQVNTHCDWCATNHFFAI